MHQRKILLKVLIFLNRNLNFILFSLFLFSAIYQIYKVVTKQTTDIIQTIFFILITLSFALMFIMPKIIASILLKEEDLSKVDLKKQPKEIKEWVDDLFEEKKEEKNVKDN